MKRDNFISSLLTLAIAILFPIVVYYFASLIVPETQSTGFSRYSSRYYNDDSEIMYRSVVALLLAFVAIFVSLSSLRPHRELFRGLIGGSIFIITISNIYVAFNVDSSDRDIGFVIQWTSFIMLYAIIHYTSRNLPHIVIKQGEQKEKSPFENPTQQSEDKKAVYPGDTTVVEPKPPKPPEEETTSEHVQQEEKQNNDES